MLNSHVNCLICSLQPPLETGRKSQTLRLSSLLLDTSFAGYKSLKQDGLVVSRLKGNPPAGLSSRVCWEVAPGGKNSWIKDPWSWAGHGGSCLSSQDLGSWDRNSYNGRAAILGNTVRTLLRKQTANNPQGSWNSTIPHMSTYSSCLPSCHVLVLFLYRHWAFMQIFLTSKLPELLSRFHLFFVSHLDWMAAQHLAASKQRIVTANRIPEEGVEELGNETGNTQGGHSLSSSVWETVVCDYFVRSRKLG